MKERLLNLLCCPACRGELILARVDERDKEIKKGSLKCAHCQQEYPVVNYIPRFVKTDKYVGNFSFEWTVHNRTQLDSANGTRESRDTFIEKTGFVLEQFKSKVVLDIGCGMGRFLEIVQPQAAEVVGVDLSLAVDSAYNNLKQYENVHIVQGDIFALPFKENNFDYIYSIGVLHHTPDTKQAFLKLPGLLQKGGTIAIWVYSDETKYLHSRNRWGDFYRLFSVYLPKKLLWCLCHAAIPFYYLKKVPKLGTLLDRTIPMSNHPDPSWRVLDTYDWFSPKYQWKHTYAEVNEWFQEAGLTEIRQLTFPVSLQGKR